MKLRDIILNLEDEPNRVGVATPKKDEISGRMFDDKLDLAYAIIDGVEARRDRGNFSTKRVKFSSTPSA